MFYSVKNLNIFKNKTVIITGHTGFKGSWLSFWLKTLGANVIGISFNIPTNPSNFKTIIGNKYIKSYKCDIKNFLKIKKIILKHRPDFVFHLAAQALVKKSYMNPLLTWNSNLLGTVNLLESLRYLKKNCVAVIVTSDKSYKNLEIKRGYVEEDQLGGYDPYSASKGAAEFAIGSFVKSFFYKKNKVKIGIARAGNVIGGGDWSEDRIIPDCVKSWSKGKIANIRNPNSTRPWQHVLEAVGGYLILAAKLSQNKKLHNQAFNFGPSKKNNFKVLELINNIKINWNNIKYKKVKSRKKFFESKLLQLNSQKSLKLIKWRSVLNFYETTKLVSDWYKNYYYGNVSVKDISLKQIKYYENLLKERLKIK